MVDFLKGNCSILALKPLKDMALILFVNALKVHVFLSSVFEITLTLCVFHLAQFLIIRYKST
jgi:hypothetical protein